MRTHYCGATKDVAVGETVTICGWVDRRRDHGGVIFLDMRDREGIVQVVFDPDTQEYFDLADRVRSEYVLQITGRVRHRAAETINPAMATGHIEILGKELVILNEAAPPPFPLDAHQSVGDILIVKGLQCWRLKSDMIWRVSFVVMLSIIQTLCRKNSRMDQL